ncbi:hypothetical protein DYU05_06150 [Mucilaginibacter terrenus]|uniref:Uncharacterized protein n=1 Tax=Mucilaginibacter terrenus TaxID=2482727 RepID=A0A3E2NWE6_9SPHI|nr:hypothetical protein DYU05_06150 [Mucilaginibacter terrenus]
MFILLYQQFIKVNSWAHSLIVLLLILLMLIIIIVQLNISNETGSRRSFIELLKWIMNLIKRK